MSPKDVASAPLSGDGNKNFVVISKALLVGKSIHLDSALPRNGPDLHESNIATVLFDTVVVTSNTLETCDVVVGSNPYVIGKVAMLSGVNTSKSSVV